ncbi:MAG: CPBP family intramembrane metalloprotease [Bacteroidia bacterium]
MNKKNLILGIILWIIGLAGVLSMLSSTIPIPEEARALLEDQFTDEQIKLLTLINPTILMTLTVVLGTVFYKKAGFKVPILESIIDSKSESANIRSIMVYGLIGGLISGVLLSAIGAIYIPLLPSEFLEVSESFAPSVLNRLLYGGFTEEIMMRFGLMSFLVWLILKALKKSDLSTWVGLLLAAILFAFGHFPVAFQAVNEPSAALLSYILIGNSIGGIIFGWLYWKKGLESAFIAHFLTHVVMLFLESLLS